LPGTPDIVFTRRRVAVFVDGDFWHGYRFSQWRDTVSPFWQQKIEKNRQRDRKNFAKLRRSGWRVGRLWKHQVKEEIEECLIKIEAALAGE